MTGTPYLDIASVRLLAGLTTQVIDDDVLSGVADLAIKFFNAEMNIEVGGSGMEYERLIAATDDDTDTIFYTQNHPLADTDGDGSVTTSDIQVFDDEKFHSPVTLEVSAVDFRTGKITLASACNSEVFARYQWTPKEYDSQDMKEAFGYYLAAMAYDRIRKGVSGMSGGGVNISFGNPWYEKFLTAKAKVLGGSEGAMVDDADTGIFMDDAEPEPRGRGEAQG